MASIRPNQLAPGSKRTENTAGPSAKAGELARVAQLFGQLPISAEQVRQFPLVDGSDEEPWDVMLSMMALDEHQHSRCSASAPACDSSPSHAAANRPHATTKSFRRKSLAATTAPASKATGA
jgi:hypothetical protein